MRLLAVLFVLFGVFFSNQFAQASLADDTIMQLQAMRGLYIGHYAPASWKKKHSGYDLDIEYARAVAAVSADPDFTFLDARQIFKNFIYAMKDYHVSIRFVSTESAKLPFVVGEAGDRFFFAWIDRTKLPKSLYPFEVGDEIMTFGGRPVLDVVKGIQAEVSENVFVTDRALATLALSSRIGARGDLVPRGPVMIAYKREGEVETRELELIWEYTAEQINPRGLPLNRPFNGRLTGSLPFNQSMDFDFMANSQLETPFDLGAKKSFIPELGTKVWEAREDNSFYAYIYRNSARKLIGYVRIPSYANGDLVKNAADFSKIIAHLEKTTDALVIDQVNNPGGNVLYLYALASMLAKQPLATPLHRMAIDQADVARAVDLIEKARGVKNDEDAKKTFPDAELNGYPSSFEFVRFIENYARFVVKEWNEGRSLTNPYWLSGVNRINPSPVHYTKPILIVVNQLDFSGGDFFPTILQDNKRVTVFGTRTAGAGGYVRDVTYQNSLGIQRYRVTQSLAERVNGDPIENLGVTPDIQYTLTVDDYQKNFAPYAKAISGAIDSITP